jgi:hypothetical protein
MRGVPDRGRARSQRVKERASRRTPEDPLQVRDRAVVHTVLPCGGMIMVRDITALHGDAPIDSVS